MVKVVQQRQESSHLVVMQGNTITSKEPNQLSSLF